MELTQQMQDAQAYVDFQWFVVLGINCIMLAIAYWIADVAWMMQRRGRKAIATGLAFGTAGIAIWRMIAVVIYYQDMAVMLAIPITAAVTWAGIGIIAYAAHRYIVGVNARFLVASENVRLTEAVQEEIVKPLLRGEAIPEGIIEQHEAASCAYAVTCKRRMAVAK